MKEMGITEINEDDARLIFKRYDTDKDGVMKFSEFSNALVPINEEYQTYLMERKPESLV
jgi:hypothetical protein